VDDPNCEPEVFSELRSPCEDCRVRIIALLASYNERRFIEPCLRHLHEQKIETFLLDDGSTDETVEVAQRWFGRGLIAIEQAAGGNEHVFSLRQQLARKEELARQLDADWFIHLDADELRLPPSSAETLASALERVDLEGFNAVNFTEFTFTPTREEPDHDHPGFQHTLRTYYPFEPRFPHHLKAWKATDAVDLTSSGGHRVSFPGLKMYPRSFPMKHYLFLSVPHAIEKYVERRYDENEVSGGWHVWRSRLEAPDVCLPSKSELRIAHDDAAFDASNPRKTHYLAERAMAR
jgi:glycosyltransferase involved in cell wall biosynthesis